ncbi:hypothetical protein [Sphingobium sp. BS19]|uniref:hypothetical protein n=1 Tax=Sphingobium sp. BS19 TaxID=3018973 RepID=UPI0022EFD283|nr:hypothetical protein [Sphingobium sp. BS19]GLJ00632.1 hypothetical protein Sbs19_44500 [Sphingobium sp. BS19]|tara:strand:- start:4045 stop:5418 length:1374 start_codon:yes stop_codon:yes gene_type:complete
MLSTADLIAAVKQRYRLELAVFIVVFVAVAVSALISPKIYTSTATLLFQTAIDPIQETASGEGDLATLLSTQADVIKSDLVASRVVDDLNLVTPDVLALWRQQTGGVGDVNVWYGASLLSGLSVVPDRASKVLRVNYKSADPAYSANIANAFVKAYLDQKLEIQTDPAKTYSRWFADRTREVRIRLEEAQAKLTAFKRRTGIVDTGTSDAETSRMTDLQAAVTSAEVGAAESGSRSAGAIERTADVQNSGIVQGLRSTIASKAAQLSQISVALGPNHPERIALEAELSELRSKLQSIVSEQSQAVRLSSAAAKLKEAQLRSSLQGQKSRMLTVAGDRAEFDVLTRDVESARSSYDQVTQKLDNMRLSAVAPTSGARQLDIARPPLLPSEPNISLRLLLGAVAAVLLAIGVAIGLELINPLVRTSGSLQVSTGVPVLASVAFDESSIGRHSSQGKESE